MQQDPGYKRDDLGNIIFPEMTEEIKKQVFKERNTYVFCFKDKNHQIVESDWHQFIPDEERTKDLPVFSLVECALFEPPQLPVSNDWIAWKNKYDYYLNEYFRPIFFPNVFQQQFPLRVDIYKILLPQTDLDKISGFIADYGLSEHRDFIFYLICKIQQTYKRDIDYYDKPEQRNEIANCPAQTNALYTVLDRSESDDYNTPQLSQITFKFDKTSSVTNLSINLTDSFLIRCVTRAAIEYWDKGGMKNWRKQLKAVPETYTELQQQNEFRTRAIKVLHNFFYDIKTFDFGKYTTTDDEVHAISSILDFAHVRFYNQKGKLHHYSDDKNEIKQIVRTTILRKEVTYSSPVIPKDQFAPDISLLNKYFDNQFISFAGSPYSAFDIGRVYATADRERHLHLIKEMTHLLCCLKQAHSFWGHQFQCPFNDDIENNEDYKAWKFLLNNSGFKISSVSLNMKDGNRSLEFKEELSNSIFERALKLNLSEHQFDFEIDFYESELQFSQESGAFRLKPSGKLKAPANRFLPRFVQECYQFFLAESPPEKNEYSPANRYYSSIADLLAEAGFFREKATEEGFILDQVKYYHSLSQT